MVGGGLCTLPLSITKCCHNTQNLIKVMKSQDARQPTIHTTAGSATIFKSKTHTPDLKGIYVLKYSPREGGEGDELFYQGLREQTTDANSRHPSRNFFLQRALRWQLRNSWVKPVRRPSGCEVFLKPRHSSHNSHTVICQADWSSPPTFTLIRSLSMVLIKHKALKVQSRMYLPI